MTRQNFVWMLFLIGGLFLFSCAGQYTPSRDTPGRDTPESIISPQKKLPQIGAPQQMVAAPPVDILVTLSKKAEDQIRSNELVSAFATLEQAVGIDPQNPVPWHLMARIQLLRGNMSQARYLAKKSNLLSAHHPSLQKKNMEIITRALADEGLTPKGLGPLKKGME